MEHTIISLINEVNDNITIIQENIEGIGFNDYRTDRKKQIAVVKALANITEACNNLPSEFKEKHQEIDWDFFAKVKSAISHTEYGISQKDVWEASKTILLKFKKLFDKISQA